MTTTERVLVTGAVLGGLLLTTAASCGSGAPATPTATVPAAPSASVGEPGDDPKRDDRGDDRGGSGRGGDDDRGGDDSGGERRGGDG